jgi:hypothetical protein
MVMEAYENVKNFIKKYHVNQAFSTKTIHRIIIEEKHLIIVNMICVITIVDSE